MQTQANAHIERLIALRALGMAVGTTVLAGALAAGLWVVAAARWAAVAAPGPAGVADVLTLLLVAAALVLLVWFAIGVLLEALAVLPGAIGRWATRSAQRLTPAVATRVAALVLGSTVVTAAMPTTAVADTTGSGARPGVVATAPDPGFAPQPAVSSAAPSATWTATRQPTQSAPSPAPSATVPAVTADPAVPAVAQSTQAPDPGFRPSRPTVRRVVAPTLVAPAGGLPAPHGVVVHRGDTLWAIAARDLGPDATDAEVAAHWPRWYAANRAVIGPDPDLVLPGQVLVRPSQEMTR